MRANPDFLMKSVQIIECSMVSLVEPWALGGIIIRAVKWTSEDILYNMTTYETIYVVATLGFIKLVKR